MKNPSMALTLFAAMATSGLLGCGDDGAEGGDGTETEAATQSGSNTEGSNTMSGTNTESGADTEQGSGGQTSGETESTSIGTATGTGEPGTSGTGTGSADTGGTGTGTATDDTGGNTAACDEVPIASCDSPGSMSCTQYYEPLFNQDAVMQACNQPNVYSADACDQRAADFLGCCVQPEASDFANCYYGTEDMAKTYEMLCANTEGTTWCPG